MLFLLDRLPLISFLKSTSCLLGFKLRDWTLLLVRSIVRSFSWFALVVVVVDSLRSSSNVLGLINCLELRCKAYYKGGIKEE
jgi:hypothetical protein